ncbi:MAG TPA: bifunctional 4-hydroxy-2-oxoglutarate aldolase/2-dehydro-3-deoxy-phosphogluconate aldolase [Bacteroidales bacterium]|nr:bifunctional 4-hydroxy-2-oxoglutarate aldolase/2-dehydro-3-deoxy-phosphogluconate aldolase [Bacteroidales bacterium]
MSRFTRIEVALKLKESGIVPVFYNANPETAIKIIEACYKGGFRVMEFTNRGDFAHEVFATLNKYAAKEMPDLILGVGSILEEVTAGLYIQLGASFIVSPMLNPPIARICNRRKIMWMPGCGSVSEISQAEELGAEVVKIYPGSQVGGPKFIAAVKGPMPWSNMMPTGGVEPTEENLRAWFQAGVYCVGIGSNLITSEIVKTGNFAKLEEDSRNLLSTLEKIRTK